MATGPPSSENSSSFAAHFTALPRCVMAGHRTPTIRAGALPAVSLHFPKAQGVSYRHEEVINGRALRTTAVGADRTFIHWNHHIFGLTPQQYATLAQRIEADKNRVEREPDKCFLIVGGDFNRAAAGRPAVKLTPPYIPAPPSAWAPGEVLLARCVGRLVELET